VLGNVQPNATIVLAPQGAANITLGSGTGAASGDESVAVPVLSSKTTYSVLVSVAGADCPVGTGTSALVSAGSFTTQ
jgi:hypothetical protein